MPDLEYAIVITSGFAGILALAAAGALVQHARERRNGPRSGEETRAGSVASRE